MLDELTAAVSAAQVCQKCGACNVSARATTQVSSFGSETPQILVVLGAPSYEGQPYQNEISGINQVIQKAMAWSPQELSQKVRYVYAVRCSKSSGKPGAVTTRACSNFLSLEILKYKPGFILGFGGAENTAVWKSLGMPHKSRGVVRWCSEVPTPARGANTSAPISSTPVMLTHSVQHVLERDPALLEEVLHDIRKIKKLYEGTYQAFTDFAHRNYEIVQDPARAEQIAEYLVQQERLAFDIETAPGELALDPYHPLSKILGVSFGVIAGGERYAWFFVLDHKDSGYTQPQRDKMADAIRKVITSPVPKVAHNSPFDATYFPQKLGVSVEALEFDTQMAHGLVDENTPHKLKRLAELYTDLGFYDDQLQSAFPGGAKDFELGVPLDVLGMYACADADATRVLWDVLEERLAKENLLTYFHEFTMPDIRSVITTQLHGMSLNVEHRNKLYQEFGSKRDAAKEAFQNAEILERWRQVMAHENEAQGSVFVVACEGDESKGMVYETYQSFKSGARSLGQVEKVGKSLKVTPADQVAWQVMSNRKVITGTKSGYRAAKAYTFVKKRAFTTNYAPVMKSAKADKCIELNLGSPDQLQRFLYGKEFCGIPEGTAKRTKTGNLATDVEVLEEHKEAHPVIEQIIAFRDYSKLFSTYCTPFVQGFYKTPKGVTRNGYLRADNLMHPSFIITGFDSGYASKDKGEGTVTGRKSAVDPPVQLIKTRGEGAKGLKKMFNSRYSPGAEFYDTPWGPVPKAEGNAWMARHFELFVLDEGQRGLVYQIDFSQLEIRVFGIAAEVQWITKRYQEGADLHLDLACELFRCSPEEALANGKLLRSLAKQFWFGPIYGQGARGLANKMKQEGFPLVSRRVTAFDRGLNGYVEREIYDEEASVESAREKLNKMYDRMPEYMGFKQQVVHDLQTRGYVCTLTGRHRHIPEIHALDAYTRTKAERQGVNSIVQGTGSDLNTWCWFTLNQWLAHCGFKTRVSASVHDSLVLDVFPGEAPIVVPATKYLMENMPFRFIKNSPVPIVADSEGGPTWGQMVEFADPIADIPAGWEHCPSDLIPVIGSGYSPDAYWRSGCESDPRFQLLANHLRTVRVSC